jgi:glucose/arabinose dehydrogenase
MFLMKILYSLLILLLLLSGCEKNKGNDENLTTVELKTEILTQSLIYPWELIYGPDNYIWFTERGGKISRLNPLNGVITLVHTITEVNSIGEGGLLGMALDPQFAINPYLYVVYDYGAGNNYRGKVVRFTFNNGQLLSPLVLLDDIPAASNHNGSRLLITADQKLLITTGDANVASQAQNTNSLSGKILRLNLDGSIPADNPIPGNPVWSYGHRNPQGLVMANGQLYSSEHGPDNDDEINHILKGKNYGWPNVEGYCNTTTEKAFCALNEVTEPMIAWTPTIAPSGLTYYNSDYIPQWKNSLLGVTLKGTQLLQLKLDENGNEITSTTEFYTNTFGRLRAICQSPEGKIYLATSNGTADKIIEISRQ